MGQPPPRLSDDMAKKVTVRYKRPDCRAWKSRGGALFRQNVCTRRSGGDNPLKPARRREALTLGIPISQCSNIVYIHLPLYKFTSRALLMFGSEQMDRFFFGALSEDKRACEPPEYRWSTLFMESRDSGGVTSALPASWVGNRISDGGSNVLMERT
ncbi:hypothetical protein EVAR_38714_1 [Eumeta japonica]|uniref:Uncharacterized protein n=1 Tax=Eumeta variegata TaxID=151549 RepID=A0A4C1XPQ3_EUMVA|nr:hypothetical protein EVAR_38714_1 [Eumeta japonica]